MKLRELKKAIRGVFKQPVRKYYFGKARIGTPYMFPWHYNGRILTIRKLKRRTHEEYEQHVHGRSWLRDKQSSIYKNLPMVLRNKYWIVRDYYIAIGWPVYVRWTDLGWKDKYETPRFEWSPQFSVFFFGLQFCVWWVAPCGNDDNYYEQILWYLFYTNRTVKEAEETWPWTSNGKSTWNKDYLL